ncbi:hypothetical protein [Polynucleobacter necessarius]|uniref:hypothetical protein n=1 Tax=Polynucleobacter necessarius TaxID=576610 RepID=UPI0013B064E3|nr:hypothetical protein [Polynucleobacter necessarius]
MVPFSLLRGCGLQTKFWQDYTLGCFARTIEDVELGAAVMSGDHQLARVELIHNKPRIGICKTNHWAFAQQESVTVIAVARYAAEAISKGVVADVQLPKSS